MKDQIGKEKKEIKSLKCLLCGGTFSNSNQLKVNTEENKVKCPTCGIACLSKISLQRHINTIHEGIKRKSKVHTESVHEENKCSICGIAFSFKTSLQRHIKTIHEGIKTKSKVHTESFICPTCGIAYSSKPGLQRHIKTIHEGIKFVSKPRISVCGKT